MSKSINLNRTPLSTSLVGPMINDLTLCRRQKLDIVVPLRPVKFYGYSVPISSVFGIIPYSCGTVQCITITETNCRPLTRCQLPCFETKTVYCLDLLQTRIKRQNTTRSSAASVVVVVVGISNMADFRWVLGNRDVSAYPLYLSPN